MSLRPPSPVEPLRNRPASSASCVDDVASIGPDDEVVLGRALVGREHVGEVLDPLDARFLALTGEVHTGAATDADDDRQGGGQRQRGAVNTASATHVAGQATATFARTSCHPVATPAMARRLLDAEVHDVADAEAVRRTGIVDDDEATVEGEIGGHAEDLSVGQLDTNAPAERRQLGAVAVAQLVGRGGQAVVGGE